MVFTVRIDRFEKLPVALSEQKFAGIVNQWKPVMLKFDCKQQCCFGENSRYMAQPRVG